MSTKEYKNLVVEQISREGALNESEVLDALSTDEGDLSDVSSTAEEEDEQQSQVK
jgi:hypothetical protein